MKKSYLILTTFVFSLFAFFCAYSASAYETVPEKVQNTGDEVKKDVKKGKRAVKRNLRDATGNHSTTEDLKDAMKNTGDEIGTKAKQLKRKAD